MSGAVFVRTQLENVRSDEAVLIMTDRTRLSKHRCSTAAFVAPKQGLADAARAQDHCSRCGERTPEVFGTRLFHRRQLHSLRTRPGRARLMWHLRASVHRRCMNKCKVARLVRVVVSDASLGSYLLVGP